jgi:two-component system response regulator
MNIVELETELTRLEIVRRETEKNAALRFGVLLADDSQADHFFAKRALDKSVCLRPVAEVYDGVEVIEYLSGSGKFEDRVQFPFPALLLLDIMMPRMNGLEVLAMLQKANFPGLRIVMLSSSLDPVNIEKALALGADYYQAKPRNAEGMDALVRRLELLMVLMHQREPKTFMKNSSDSPPEGMLPYTMLKLVDGRDANWHSAIRLAADSKRNFVLILKNEDDLEKLWSVLGTTNMMPERMGRWGILAMAEALETNDYALLLEIYRENAIYLVEQLTLERNAPPHTQRYILYCELRGIISDHQTIEEAGISLLGYLNFFKRARLLPLAGIYEYVDRNWVRVKKLTSAPL